MEEAPEAGALSDLQFLFASDEQLQDELAYVCTLLDGPSSTDGIETEEEKPKHTTKRKLTTPPKSSMKNKFEFRQKQEMYLLKKQVDALKLELDVARRRQATTSPKSMSKWERAARQAIAEKNMSLAENERLRAAVVEQETFLEHMQAMMTKKPRLHMLSEADTADWQSFKLAAQESLRLAAIHAIADRQVRRKEQEFIHARVFDGTDDVFMARTIPVFHEQFRMELVESATLHAPWDVVSDAVWQVFIQGSPLPPTATETIEFIDANTIYAQFSDLTCRPAAYSNVIRKRYAQHMGTLAVWKTVQHDARMPQLSSGAVDDESGWIEVTSVDDKSCRLTMVVHVQVDPNDPLRAKQWRKWREIVTIENMTAMMDKFFILQPPPVPGMGLTAAPPVATVDRLTETTFGQYFRKGKRFEVALKDAVNDAILRYHEKIGNSPSTSSRSLTNE
ncbi:hypothetical protein LEN26_014459 [Aphanomyces euteiches]|nr:hypothetical protein LEN26_014459 [Aphanomyces euteiches]